MQLVNDSLESWLEEKTFKKENDLFTKYRAFVEYLKRNYYSDIETGAQISDPNLVLNKHGYGHTQNVIRYASKLVETDTCILNVYEVYMLLVSILFHDVGNIFEREGHEKTANKIMSECREFFSDNVERTNIRKIVEAHGGRDITGNKDKISHLEEEVFSLYGLKVRMRLIASILRFADELADDTHRASLGLIKHGKLPETSRIHHLYSKSLYPPDINHNNKQITLHYHIDEEHVYESFSDSDWYLIDEIYTRLLKMHLERLYCMRFAKTCINLERITGEINILCEDNNAPIKRISFDLYEKGYPSAQEEDIYQLCPSLTKDSIKMSGAFIKEQFEKNKKGNHNEKL